jgi:septum formation inhibitor-activating ATPase MinD
MVQKKLTFSGGVGKTTTAASIGFGLAERGFRTCVIDFDVGLRNLDIHFVRSLPSWPLDSRRG